MNEIDLLRRQLALERARVTAVARACVAVPGAVRGPSLLAPWHAACVEYLRCVLTWFEARDRRLAALAETDALPEAPPGGGLSATVAQWPERLESAAAGRLGWPAFSEFLEQTWGTRRDALDAVRDSLPRVAQWRAVAGIDAESILTERRLYARVKALLPAGASLEPSAAAAAPGEI